MEFQIKVEDDRIADVKFRTFGCGAAIAVSSMVSEMAKGRTLDEAMEINNKAVATELGGLPKNKLHCSNLGADALHKAIEDYRSDGKTKRAVVEEKVTEHEEEVAGECHCPHCDVLVSNELTFCSGCGAKLRFCSNCGCAVPRTADRCPNCDAQLETAAD
jgi:nitrogen fixation NifU-like protein